MIGFIVKQSKATAVIKNIASSFISRIGVLLLTFVVVVLNSRILGDTGQGTAALIQLGILLIVSVTNFIGGGAVVYLTPRIAPRALLLPAYIWSAAVALLFWPLLHFTALVPVGFAIDVCVLGLLQALFTFHLQIAMGKERIRAFNAVVLIQALVLALVATTLLLIFDKKDIQSYVYALYASFATTYLLSLFISRNFLKKTPEKVKFGNAWRELWHYGRYAQGGNILQLLNNRANLYLLERLLLNGRGAAGIFSIALYAGEAVWSVGKSLALVQYARIANSNDQTYNNKITVRFLYLSTAATIVPVAAMVLLPESIYLWVFGDRMAGLHQVLVYIAPGIVANSASMIFSHHFSGIGKHHRNTLSSGMALAAMVSCALVLIPVHGVDGAAMAASMGYGVQLAALGWMFFRHEGVTRSDMVFKKSWLNDLRKK